MEITSIDAKDVKPLPIDSIIDSSPNSNLTMNRLSSTTEPLNLNRRLESASILPEGLAGLKLSHTKQKGDCLYLYSQDRETGSATKILEAIATSTQDLESSVLFAEGIRRLKLHGNAWALGVDLPIAQSAIIAAEIIAALLNNFCQDSKLAQTKLKLLLQNNCLNLLCETRVAILQAEMALPMLDTLRTVDSAEYFQSVTVSNRVIGQKNPSWSFEIDLLAIGVKSANPELPSPEESQDDNTEIFDHEDDDQPIHWQKLARFAIKQLIIFSRDILQFKWLGQTSPKTLSLSTGLVSFAIGIGATMAIDRTLYYYAQLNEPTKFVIADPKISLQENLPEKGIISKPALNFNIALFNEKLALLDWQITNKQRSPEVLIVGSSRALRGIDPSILEKTLISKGYKDISVFNLGIDGATAKVVNLQITQILSRPQLPRLIIWADGLRAFNSGRTDLTYDEIAASTGYKQLQETLKNNGSNPELASTNNTSDAKALNPVTQAINTLFATSTKRPEIRASVVKSFDRNTHMLSNSEALLASTMPSTATALDSKGFVAFDVTFEPNIYFQKFPQVPGDYDLDYRNFEPSGAQFDAFANVVDFCRRNNIELLVVNMPLHATYLDGIRTRYEATFNRRMEELALREGFTYLDISQAIQNQAELFSDPSHLNKQGAIVIAKMLAQNPKIRWQSLKF